MKSPLQILTLEDNPADSDLILATLSGANIKCEAVRVETESNFVAALARGTFDLILSAHSLACFDGSSALRIALGRAPGVPFIFVSGAMGADMAIELIRSGATDYVFKDRLSRLVPAVRRAIAEAEERAARQEAERSRSEAESLFRILFDQAVFGVAIISLEGRIVWANHALEAMLGYGKGEVSQRRMADLGRPDDVAEGDAAYEELLAGRRTSIELETRFMRRGGAIRLGRVVASLIRDDNGIPRFSVRMIEDITDRREMERQFLQAQLTTAASESASRAKTAFLSTMSHEIRTPMNAILGYAQLMLRDPGLGTEAKANLRIIRRSGEHLLTLINDVPDVSRIEPGRIELNPVTFDFSTLLNDLAAMFRLRAGTKGLRFEMFVDGEAVPYIVGDEGKIRQALINLLGNAIKFTRRGQVKLRVTLHQRNANGLWLSARIEDSGAGITDAEQQKLFEPFTQGRKGHETRNGIGLGLAITRSYARLMGGDVTVSSSPGNGSIFHFEIPVERGIAGVAGKPRRARRVIGIRPGTNAPKILIVDDQVENREWLMKLLALIGFSVRSADNGETAIQSWEAWRPRLILMDMLMPIMDGLEATRIIKADPRGEETAILFLTAGAMAEDRRTAAQSGADDFLSKPCREEDLLEKLRILLDIDYDYEDVSETVSQSRDEGEERLCGLPPALIEELRNATFCGNVRRLNELIGNVRQTADAGSANTLQELADKYEYDALTQLLEEACRR
jgi:PAS domain S-box-containing protein